MKIYRFQLFVTAILICCSASVWAGLTMAPYLQAVTPTSIYVMVESTSKDPVTVEYGTSDKLGSTAKTKITSELNASPKAYIHKIKLDNLTPATKYYYRATLNNRKSNISEFTTAVEGAGNFRFAIMGDCRSNPKMHAKIAKDIIPFNPVFSMYNGDLCMNSSHNTWKEEFFIPEELELISKVPFFNAIGNHEGWTQNTQAFQQTPESKSGKQEYYSFDYGDIHFLVLSTEHPCKKGSQQYEFAKSDLKSSNKKFKIVVFHESAYCGGGHGDNKVFRALSEEVFEKSAVDVVLTGHSHFYQHNLVNGIHHFTVAGGGAPLYTPKDTKFTKKSAKVNHFGIADYIDGKLTITIYTDKLEVLDKLELKK